MIRRLLFLLLALLLCLSIVAVYVIACQNPGTPPVLPTAVVSPSPSPSSASINPTNPATPSPTANACLPPASFSLSVPFDPQEASMWCWAASGQMTLAFLGTTVRQGEEANLLFHRTDCLNSPIPSDCDQGGLPDFPAYGFHPMVLPVVALTWDQVKEQIFCKKQPFVFSYWWWQPHFGGHMLVGTGYSTTPSGVRIIFANDPWPPATATTPGGDHWAVTYDAYKNGPQVGWNHALDYYDFH